MLRFVGETANAYYYAAWTVSISARLLAVNISDVFIVEGAYAEQSVRDLVHSVAKLAGVVLGSAIIVLLLGADVILRLFGASYADAGAPLLRYFALALLPFTVTTFVIAFDRVRERYGAAIVIAGVGAVTTVALDVILLPELGITGAGMGWLAGQTVAAVLALATLAHGQSREGDV